MHRYTILIVDDDRLLQSALDCILSEQYQTLIAGRGEEALRLLVGHPVEFMSPDMQIATIDHAMGFHRPIRVDDWILYVQFLPSAAIRIWL